MWLGGSALKSQELFGDGSQQVGISSGNQALKRCAFVGTNATSEVISSGLPFISAWLPDIKRRKHWTIGRASYCAGPERGDHNDVRSFTEDGQELLHTKLRSPTRATKSIFHVGIQVIMRRTNYYLISRAKCFNY